MFSFQYNLVSSFRFTIILDSQSYNLFLQLIVYVINWYLKN